MKKQKKILIFAEGISMAHPSRMSQLCRKIQQDNFEFHIATPKSFFWLFKDIQNAVFHDHPTISNQLFNRRLYETKFPLTIQELNDFKKFDVTLINEIKPELIINDFRLSAYSAVKPNNIPFINLIQYHWHPDFKKEKLLPLVRPVKLFGRTLSGIINPIISPIILNNQLKLINQFLNSHNLQSCRNIYEFYCSGDYQIFPDVPSLFDKPTLKTNGPVEKVRAHIVYI